MIDKNIEIRLIQDSDIESVIEFVNGIFNIEYNYDNFFNTILNSTYGPSIYVVAKNLKTNEIIGTHCIIPHIFKDGLGKIYLTGKSEHSALKKTFRKRGLFGSLIRLAEEQCEKIGIVFIWGFNNISTQKEKYGYHSIYNFIIRGVLFRNHHFNTPKSEPFSNMLAGILSLYSLLIQDLKFLNNKKLSNVDLLKMKNDQIFLTLSTGNIFQDFSEDYLKWRINVFQNIVNIKGYQITLGGKIIGSINLAYPKMASQQIELINLNYVNEINLETKIKVTIKCIEQITKICNITRINVWSFPTQSESLETKLILKKCGFVFNNKGLSLTYKSLLKSIKIEDFVFNRFSGFF